MVKPSDYLRVTRASDTKKIVVWLRHFVNSDNLDHELMVVVVSYLFVFAGAWNDSLLGLRPSLWSSAAEWIMATILLLEIASRIVFSRVRHLGFWAFLTFDIVSVLTVIPFLSGVALARLARLIYASGRTVRLIDRLACRKQQPMYLLGIYPLIVPLSAALLYAVERHSAHPALKTYLDAVGMSLGFALTLGSQHPNTYAGNIICGLLFVGGVVCIGIVANSLSARYQVGFMSSRPKGHSP